MDGKCGERWLCLEELKDCNFPKYQIVGGEERHLDIGDIKTHHLTANRYDNHFCCFSKGDIVIYRNEY